MELVSLWYHSLESGITDIISDWSLWACLWCDACGAESIMDRAFEISTSKGANHYRCGRARKNHTPEGQSLSFCFPTLACMHLDGLISVLNKFSLPMNPFCMQSSCAGLSHLVKICCARSCIKGSRLLCISLLSYSWRTEWYIRHLG